MPKNRFLKLCCVRTDGYDDTDEEMEQLQRKLEDEHLAKNPPPVIVDSPAPEINPKLLSREESQKATAPKVEEKVIKQPQTAEQSQVVEQPQVAELNKAAQVELEEHTTHDQKEISSPSPAVSTQTGSLEANKNESNQPKTAQTSQYTKPSETIYNVQQPDKLPQATLPQKTEAVEKVETIQQSNKPAEPLRTQPSVEDKWSKLIKARAQGEDLSEDTLERELKKTSPKQNRPPQQTQHQPVERKPRDELDEKWSRIVSKRAQGVELSESDL